MPRSSVSSSSLSRLSDSVGVLKLAARFSFPSLQPTMAAPHKITSACAPRLARPVPMPAGTRPAREAWTACAQAVPLRHITPSTLVVLARYAVVRSFRVLVVGAMHSGKPDPPPPSHLLHSRTSGRQPRSCHQCPTRPQPTHSAMLVPSVHNVIGPGLFETLLARAACIDLWLLSLRV